MVFGYWSDTDIGSTHDDYVGCDTLINLGYCYNADSNDENYFGYNPPSVGYVFLEGSKFRSNDTDSTRNNYYWEHGIKDQKMTSFSNIHYSFPVCFSLGQAFVQYSYLNGLICDGTPYINPIDGQTTKFPFSGNPVDSSGWYMGFQNIIWPDDVQLYLNSGPITMAPSDTQEVVIAIIAARGTDNLQSITELKNSAKTVQCFYDNYIPEITNTSYTPPLPEYYYLSQNYPNPFNPITQIEYELPVSGITTLVIYDILGNTIATLVKEEKAAGFYSVEFNASNLPSGVYFYTLNSKSFSRTKKMIVIK
jgi:hypothetical protein